MRELSKNGGRAFAPRCDFKLGSDLQGISSHSGQDYEETLITQACTPVGDAKKGHSPVRYNTVELLPAKARWGGHNVVLHPEAFPLGLHRSRRLPQTGAVLFAFLVIDLIASAIALALGRRHPMTKKTPGCSARCGCSPSLTASYFRSCCSRLRSAPWKVASSPGTSWNARRL